MWTYASFRNLYCGQRSACEPSTRRPVSVDRDQSARGSALQSGGLRQAGFLGVWTSALEQFARKHSSVRHISKIQDPPQDTFI